MPVSVPLVHRDARSLVAAVGREPFEDRPGVSIRVVGASETTVTIERTDRPGRHVIPAHLYVRIFWRSRIYKRPPAGRALPFRRRLGRHISPMELGVLIHVTPAQTADLASRPPGPRRRRRPWPA